MMKLARVEGPAFEILRKERVVLNLIQRMSGVSTETNKYVSRAYRKNIKILDTRKTTPGLRLFEKFAVAIGGVTMFVLNQKEESPDLKVYDAELLDENETSSTT